MGTKKVILDPEPNFDDICCNPLSIVTRSNFKERNVYLDKKICIVI